MSGQIKTLSDKSKNKIKRKIKIQIKNFQKRERKREKPRGARTPRCPPLFFWEKDYCSEKDSFQSLFSDMICSPCSMRSVSLIIFSAVER